MPLSLMTRERLSKSLKPNAALKEEIATAATNNEGVATALKMPVDKFLRDSATHKIGRFNALGRVHQSFAQTQMRARLDLARGQLTETQNPEQVLRLRRQIYKIEAQL